jgi:outer membrane protein assembly factor BamB
VEPLSPGDPRTAGEFRLSARLGHGGMGQVFLGYSPAGRAVAVKMCHPELAADPSFVQRFARETAAAQAVNGLYTAQVVGAGPYDTPPWMATAYVPGPSLTDYVYGYGALPEVAAWRLAGGLAEALVAVHAAGLVHRDLKPSNVLLAVDGPRVIDFGISSALEMTGLTTEGSVMGSPPYMSPEQALGEPSGPPSDVFSLGSTVAFAAGGAPPFGDGDAPGVLFRVVHTAPQIGHLPPGLREMVAACLAKDPAARPTLAQLLRGVQDATAGYAGSAGSFWPGQVTSVIVSHQASPSTPPSFTHQGTAAGPAGPQHATMASAGVSTFLPPDQGGPGGTPAGGTGTRGGIGRRRLLFGAGGLVVAGGLAVAGVELTSGGGKPKPAPPADSRLAWKHAADGALKVTPGIADDGGTVYFGSAAGTVLGLDARTGRPVSSDQVGGAVSGLTMVGGTLLAGSADGKVHALPVDNGVSWISDAAGGPIAGAPSRYQNSVYAGSEDHYVYALNLNTGQRKWKTKTGGTVQVATPPGTGYLTAVSADGTIYSLDTDTGKVAGKKAYAGQLTTAALLAKFDVYFGTSTGVLYDIESFDSFDKTWEFGWTFTADAAITGTPVVASGGDVVFVGTTAGTVSQVSHGGLGNPGTALWSMKLGGPVRTGMAVSDNVAYVGCDDGYLYAIDITTQKTSWKYKVGAPVTTAVLVANKLVYFGAGRQVYALRVA